MLNAEIDLERMIEQTLNAEEEMMTTRSVNEASIVALRDKAMAMLKQGAWHDDGKGHRLLIRETEDLRLAYAVPLQMGAEEMPEEMKYFAAAIGRSGHLPHELSVWRKAPPQKVLGRASPATVHAEADAVNAHSRTAAAAGCKDASDEAGARVRLSRATTHRSFASEDADEGRGATDCRQHRAVAGASREGGSRLKPAGTRRSCTGRMHALRSGEPT